MTREEAIKYIDGLHVVPCEQLKEFCDERNEAIDMAIEALQWQDRILTQIEDIVLKEHGEKKDK